MDAEQKAGYEVQSQQLRLELKKWETTWARDHDGTKPSRDDIKRNTEIAQKYTTYNKLRNVLSGKTPASELHTKDSKKDHHDSKDDGQHRRKRKSNEAPALQQQTTPSKRLRPARTPLKENTTSAYYPAAGADAVVTPSISRKLFSPVVPTSIGPTPQRDGRVLGLFDVLSEEHNSSSGRRARRPLGVDATPSKCTGLNEAVDADATTISLFVTTPRKQTLSVNYDNDDADDRETGRRLGRTPMSSAKRNLLDRFTAGSGAATTRAANAPLFTTPLKARDVNAFAQQQQPPPQQQLSPQDTPSKEFATPAFLRRAPALPTLDENGVFLSPPNRLRLPRKPLVRGLSSVLASLRRQEDDELDEQLDVLREMEEMEAGGPPPARPPTTRTLTKPAAAAVPPRLSKGEVPKDSDVQVGDSQFAAPPQPEPPMFDEISEPRRLLDGFDDEGMYDSPPEEQTGRDGQPLRVFKKKGQKRTTRFVRMRPTRAKRPEPGAMVEEEGSDGELEQDVVPETQVDETALLEALVEDLSGSEFGDGDEDKTKKAKKTTSTKDAKDGKGKKTGKSGKDGKDGSMKKAARKVNELAHANFKRLKLRNTGSKGGPGFNSRFRRRR